MNNLTDEQTQALANQLIELQRQADAEKFQLAAQRGNELKVINKQNNLDADDVRKVMEYVVANNLGTFTVTKEQSIKVTSTSKKPAGKFSFTDFLVVLCFLAFLYLVFS